MNDYALGAGNAYEEIHFKADNGKDKKHYMLLSNPTPTLMSRERIGKQRDSVRHQMRRDLGTEVMEDGEAVPAPSDQAQVKYKTL